MRHSSLPRRRGPTRGWAPLLSLALLPFLASPGFAAPLATTTHDFEAAGTQPLALVDEIAQPSACTNCHSDFGHDAVEPYKNWAGSMMAQSARDPLVWAAIAIANQDANHGGESCLRCHVPGAWLSGRSTPEDGSSITAADREGVQCNICHRLVDPLGVAGAPAEDAAILAALTEPVTTFANAMMVFDPEDRLRGPFDIITDLGEDPHIPHRSTLVSPFHESSDLCGTCHNVRNPLFTRDSNGDYIPNANDEAGDVELGFPEQLTYTEWKLSEFAATGVSDPRFGGNATLLTTCQDCHMPDGSGRDAKNAPLRDNIPVHKLLGANTFIPRVLPYHPVFGSEVDPVLLEESATAATDFLRRAADLVANLDSGVLRVRVINRTGHKLPTGYPEGRRMWLHVRTFDATDALVSESGRYVHSSATLQGYAAEPGEPAYDPDLEVFEVQMGMSQAWADQIGKEAGKSFHLLLNNVILKDTRLPPRGFAQAAFAAAGAEPVGASYADGQYWADAEYEAIGAVRAEVTLYYQTASRPYIEFLHDENTTNAAGPILYDLWDEHGKSAPVAMAKTVVTDEGNLEAACARNVDRMQAKYLKTWTREWGRCLLAEATDFTCDSDRRGTTIASAIEKLHSRLGGLRDAKCAGEGLTPQSIGHASVCPVPCAGTVTLNSAEDLATCSACLAESLGGVALEAAYGTQVPELPDLSLQRQAAKCQKLLAKSAEKSAGLWAKEIMRCAASGGSDCLTERAAQLAQTTAKNVKRLSRCKDWTGLSGCGASGEAAAAAACIDTALAGAITGYTQAAYPADIPEGQP